MRIWDSSNSADTKTSEEEGEGGAPSAGVDISPKSMVRRAGESTTEKASCRCSSKEVFHFQAQ